MHYKKLVSESAREQRLALYKSDQQQQYGQLHAVFGRFISISGVWMLMLCKEPITAEGRHHNRNYAGCNNILM